MMNQEVDIINQYIVNKKSQGVDVSITKEHKDAAKIAANFTEKQLRLATSMKANYNRNNQK